jgi:hypothetical protein
VVGSIEDFEFALERAEAESLGEEFVASRTAWVEALRAGKDPALVFDMATLAKLR